MAMELSDMMQAPGPMSSAVYADAPPHAPVRHHAARPSQSQSHPHMHDPEQHYDHLHHPPPGMGHYGGGSGHVGSHGSHAGGVPSGNGGTFGALVNDEDVRLALVVACLVLVAQHSQAREAARALGKAAGTQVAHTIQEQIIIAAAMGGVFWALRVYYGI